MIIQFHKENIKMIKNRIKSNNEHLQAWEQNHRAQADNHEEYIRITKLIEQEIEYDEARLEHHEQKLIEAVDYLEQLKKK